MWGRKSMNDTGMEKNCYVESIIYRISERMKEMIAEGVIADSRRILIYGLDVYSFAIRTVLENAGFQIDGYISDDRDLLVEHTRRAKAAKARYFNSSRDMIGMFSIEEKLHPFDERILIICASKECPVNMIESLGYRDGTHFFQVFDWEKDEFADATCGRQRITLKEIQGLAKDMLYMADRFCRQRGIRYWVCGGTLLGTVRHKGFIPWDDDVDIFMPWEDYKRFVGEFRPDGYYSVVSPDYVDRRDYHLLFSKIIDHRTVVREDSAIIRKIRPVSIDIFPLIGLPGEESDRISYFKRYQEMERMIWEDFYANDGDLDVFNKWYPSQKEFLERYDFDESAYVGVLATAYAEKDCTTKEVYQSTIRMPFEDIEVNAPAGYKEYLDNLYGKDWMIVPGEDKRGLPHSLEAYWI